MRNLKLTLAYEGTRFSGWQIQKDVRTVQGQLLTAMIDVLREKPRIIAAGRTDRGVHAEAQVVNAVLHGDPPVEKSVSRSRDIPLLNTAFHAGDHANDPHLWSAGKIMQELNNSLPADLTVTQASFVPLNFHSRHDARSRSYRYQLVEPYTPFLRRHAWCPRREIKLPVLQEAAKLVVGRHSFRSFCDPDEEEERSFQCTVDECEWRQIRITRPCYAELLTFHIRADRFLWKMVRRLVGSMVELSAGHCTRDEFGSFFYKPSPKPAEWTAPPFGLFLEKVFY
ncbi:MAG: tRNA pseudouridine(38-40) synthase TruA [Terriglobia bacterium]